MTDAPQMIRCPRCSGRKKTNIGFMERKCDMCNATGTIPGSYNIGESKHSYVPFTLLDETKEPDPNGHVAEDDKEIKEVKGAPEPTKPKLIDEPFASNERSPEPFEEKKRRGRPKKYN